MPIEQYLRISPSDIAEGKIVCGPILRRASREKVEVFLVTSKPAEIILIVKGDNEQFANAPVATHPIGTSAHAVLVGCNVSLEAGRIYSYDLSLTFEGAGPPKQLADLGLTGPDGLGYRAGALPSFSLPAEGIDAVIVNGSCRMPHGDQRDCLPLCDTLIANDVHLPNARPHHLLLTGDQIYADDVHPFMLAAARAVALSLGIGTSEAMPLRLPAGASIPFASPGGGLGTLPIGAPRNALWQVILPRTKRFGDTHLAKLMPHGPANHAEYVRTQLELTSSHLDFHLTYFADYAAMYLLVWSDALWRTDMVRDASTDMQPFVAMPPTLASNSAGEDGAYREICAKATKQFRQVSTFVAGLRAVRRAMANVPVAMMFDDHEVTDDWNLDHLWVERSGASPGTKQMIRNGLLAYAVFQDWGNRPQDYAPDNHGRALLDFVVAGLPPSGSADVERILGLTNLSGTPADQRKSWHHHLASDDYVILFLDCRTNRVHRNGALAAQTLISRESLARQFAEITQSDGRRLVLISGTPVFGAFVVEFAQIKSSLAQVTAYDHDLESWACTPDGLSLLVAELAPFRSVIVLSGDVHYSFANSIALSKIGANDTLQIAQFCSSALSNEVTVAAIAITTVYDNFDVIRLLSADAIDLLLSKPNVPSIVLALLTAGLIEFLDPTYHGLIDDRTGKERRQIRGRMAATAAPMIGAVAGPNASTRDKLANLFDRSMLAANFGNAGGPVLVPTFTGSTASAEATRQLLAEAEAGHEGWRLKSRPASAVGGESRLAMGASHHDLGPVGTLKPAPYMIASNSIGVLTFAREATGTTTATETIYYRADGGRLMQRRYVIPLDPAGAQL